jgi:adenosylhomocysteine nucleosidase
MLVSAGVAGALRRELKTGHVITAREVVDAETGTRFVTAGGAGVVVTAIGLSGEGDKRMLRESFGGDVVDMEAATVAGVAAKHGLEFAAVKSVSDELDFVMPPLAQFVDASGQFATAKFVRHISVRPHWWGATWNLSKNTRTASVNLSCAVEHLIQQHAKATQKENVSLG